MEELERLAKLRDKGLITDKQYQSERNRIVPSPTDPSPDKTEDRLGDHDIKSITQTPKSNESQQPKTTEHNIQTLSASTEYKRPNLVWAFLVIGFITGASFVNWNYPDGFEGQEVAVLIDFGLYPLLFFGIAELIARSIWKSKNK